MDRRQFVSQGGASLAAASLGWRCTRQARAQSSSSPDVAVIGAGTFGVWTAYHLNRLGAKVVLLDAYGPGNSRASSGGETRQMQADWSSDVYTRSAIDSYGWWKRIERESGVPVVLETGKLKLSTTSENIGVAQEIKARHKTYGLPEAEILREDELRHRWPQLHSRDLRWGLYTRGAAGSVMMARKGVQTVARELVKQGGELRIAYCEPQLSGEGKFVGVRTRSGDALRAGQYVFAGGPWLPRLFPKLLKNRLQVQRRDVLFFGSPPGDARFSFPHFPTWSVIGSGYYGFPDIAHRGFKVAPYPDKNTIDPDSDERLILPHQVKRGREFLRRRFPDLEQMPVVETRVCQLTNTVDENFIAGEHPDADNVWIVGGGSGHGFKHGPAVGEHLAKQILGKATDDGFRQTFTVLKPEFS